MHSFCNASIKLNSALFAIIPQPIVFVILFIHASTFDEYAAEVRSGRLEWSPVHKSEKFWVTSVDKLIC